MTTTRPAACSSACCSSRIRSSDSALRRSGRLSVIRVIGPTSSTRRCCQVLTPPTVPLPAGEPVGEVPQEHGGPSGAYDSRDGRRRRDLCLWPCGVGCAWVEPVADLPHIGATPGPIGVDLLWIPLGAGAHVVRVSGKVFEAASALRPAARAVRAVPLGPGGRAPRRPVRRGDDPPSRPRRVGARGRRRRRRRIDLARSKPAVPLRDPSLARRRHPRCRRRDRQPGTGVRRPAADAADPRSGAVGADAGLGARRAPRG